MSTPKNLRMPYCRIVSPTCGACGEETCSDGDSFYCDPCGLDYGDGDERYPAEYRDDDADPCAKPCDNKWHKSGEIGPCECGTCILPEFHESLCYTSCEPLPHGQVTA